MILTPIVKTIVVVVVVVVVVLFLTRDSKTKNNKKQKAIRFQKQKYTTKKNMDGDMRIDLEPIQLDEVTSQAQEPDHTA